MLKLGIIGSDSSHAVKFAQLLNNGKEINLGQDFRVTHIYGINKDRTEKVAVESKINKVVNSPEEMLGEIDGLMVLFRDGNLHKKFAMPFIRAGLPIFIDKPLGISLEDCRSILYAAQRYGSLLTSFSTIRFTDDIQNIKDSFNNKKNDDKREISSAYFTGPCDFKSEYGGAYFYGTHVLEMMLEILGYNLRSVTTNYKRSGDIVCVFEFNDDKTAVVNFIQKGKGIFFASVLGEEKHIYKEININNCYRKGLEVFLNMLKTGGKPLSDEQMLIPIKLIKEIIDLSNNKKHIYKKLK